MAFPTSPTNGQTAIVNSVTYQYANSTNAWTRILSTANIITANTIAVNGNISAAGNVTGNYIFGNGSQLTGISALSASYIANGTSNVDIPTVNGNVTIGIGGTGNVAVFSTTGEYITGVLSVSGNVTAGNLSGTSIVGTLTTAAQTTITSVGTLTGGTWNATSISTTYTDAKVTSVATRTGAVTLAQADISGLTTGSTPTFAGLTVGAGTITGGNIVNGNGNGVGNIGSSALYFNTVFAKATSAQYADLAEKYLADAEYEIGTVLAVGGDAEVTACKIGDRAIGAVSENPAYKMNDGLENGTYVALKGRVPVRVVGTVRKGQRLVAANDGCAVAGVPHANDVFAVALESSDDTGVKLIESLIL